MNISLNLEVMVKQGRLVLTDRDGKTVSFSPEQSVQRKVSMVTFGELCDVPKLKLAEAFGFKTRKSYYDARNVVLQGAPADLLPKRRGPQRPPKRTRDVEILIIGTKPGDAGLHIGSYPANSAIDEKVISDNSTQTEPHPIG